MSRDFAKKSRAPARRHSTSTGQTPGWLFFVAGVVFGAFAASLYFIKNPANTPETKELPKAKVEENKTPKPRFDFYKLLQESETIVPASETMAEEKPAQEQGKEEYILQVGSFPKGEDADKLRAQLILINLDARIEKVEIRKGEIWHRVVVGPFNTQAELSTARSQLVNNQYNALVLKRAKTK
ncbi:Sporulation related repeat family [Cellvibrio sp. BR]|uniref:SPOR domain-containing protein n=1 Tax=Cellvibrio sp. BR TaxID=1134474 RepID=UPI0002600941|nr:SPOR domain-containing protein [Cellvibrio sp. BR]EIK43502.1 Sporulation related repeat family [Cellvibrio sp. BR]